MKGYWIYTTGLLWALFTLSTTAQTPISTPHTSREQANNVEESIPYLSTEISTQILSEIPSTPRLLSEAGLTGETLTQNINSASNSQVFSRIGVQFTTGSGVGYESSFGSLEGFVPLQQSANNLTFLEGRLNLATEESGKSGNIVVGHRFYNERSDSLRDGRAERIFGGYLAYDIRDTGNSIFHQVGAGFESLGTWDFRANAYVPVGNTRQQTDETITTSSQSFSDPFFQGNFLAQTRNLQLQRDRRFEAAMTGFDVEAGGKITSLGNTGDLRGYAGIYYFDAPEDGGIVGFRTRLEARPTDNFRVGLSLSNDATFGTNLVLSVGATFPGTPRVSRNSIVARLGESVARNENIIVDEQFELENLIRQDTIIVTNPTTRQPWIFRHVNLGIGTGNGTFESPTGTVAEALAIAQSNDIVYIQRGSDIAIPGFTIPAGVQVFSSSPIQRINTVELGTIPLPFSGSNQTPRVMENVILGNNTTLSGFAFSGAGIRGNNISNVTIRENAISNSNQQGVLLRNVTGKIEVTANTIANSGSQGLSLINSNGQVNLLLDRNAIANNGIVTSVGDGVNLQLSNNAIGTFNLTNNQITGNQFRGVNLELESKTSGSLIINNNIISNNQVAGVNVQLSDSATGNIEISDSQIINNRGFGINLDILNRTQGTFNINRNIISDNQDTGINLQLSNTAKGTGNILNNQEIARNGNYGLFANLNGNTQLRVLVDSNQVFNNSAGGIYLNTFNGAKIFSSIRLNILKNNGNNLEVLTNSSNDRICLQPLNNTIGTLTLDDSPGGQIQVEAGTLETNTITTSNLTNWSGTTVAPGTCGF